MVEILFLLWFSDFKEAEHKWRVEREARLTAEDGWLNLVGLHFLEEGSTSFGTSEDANIVLPAHSATPLAGHFFLKDGVVTYKMQRAQLGLLNGEPKPEGTLRLDPQDVLSYNNLRFFLIDRDGKVALRIRDLRAQAVRDFKGLSWYRAKDKYIVEGTFKPYPVPETITISTVIDTEYDVEVPGFIEFEWEGELVSFQPIPENDGRFFIIFKDKSSGSTTYPAGRFLYVDPPGEDGKVLLNFNRAYSPPCAFTNFATCPLPPAQNWLPVTIDAGEKFLTEGH